MFPFEIGFLKMLEGIRTPFLNSFFECVSMLGEDTVLIVLMAVLYFGYSKDIARKIFFSTALSLGTNCVIKNFVRLPRPFANDAVSCVRPETATGYSFPSGHTQTIASWSTTLAVHTKKRTSYIFCTVLIVLMAFSRMYLGAHYPSDVIIGALLGVSFALLGNHLYERFPNKTALCGVVILLLTPLAVYYLSAPDAQYADFFKLYGLFAGFTLSIPFEEKFIQFTNNVSVGKFILRIVCVSILAALMKSGLKKLFACDQLQLSLILDGVRYFVLAFVILGICPWIFKKLQI